jgi:hypothetical protein
LTPAQVAESVLHYPVDRSIRHQTLLCYMSVSGNADCLLLVSSDPRALGIFEKGV